MKFHTVIEGVYEVSDQDLEEEYGTSDPDACAKADESLSPEELVSYLVGPTVTITAIPSAPHLSAVKETGE